MRNSHLVRGLFLILVAAAFGFGSLSYQIGHFSKSGPGLFPLLVSCMVGVIGIFTLIRARYVEPEPLSYNVRNMVIILLSFVGFALISQHLNMTAGIVFLVFASSYAGSSQSVSRSLKISAVLLAIAFVFQRFLGLNLALF